MKRYNFKKLLQITTDKSEENSKVKKMEDVELVLRFFALIEDHYKSYKKTKEKQFKDFLSDTLALKNKLDTNKIDEYALLFRNTMKFIHDNFGDLAFAKYKYDDNVLKKQSNFNAAVYDALSVAIASEVNLNNSNITKDKVAAFKNLFRNQTFFEYVNGSILDSTKLIYRVNLAREIFK